MPERTEYAPGTPSWVDLSSTDIDSAKDFYATALGWSYDDQDAGEYGTYSMALSGGKAAAGLMAQQPEQAEQGMPAMWNTYVTVEDAEQACGAAQAAGGQIYAPVMDVLEAGKMAVLGDPTGAACCVWEPKNHIGAQVVNEPGAFCWSDLQTGDQAAAAAFYGEVFGWESQQVDMPTGTGTMFTLDQSPVASASNAPEGVPPHWGVYFAVADCDGCTSTITDNGGQVMMGPFDTPPGRMAIAMDPAGAPFNIIQLNPDFSPGG